MTPVIEVRDLSKRYDEIEAVRGIGFTVEEGETFGFLGPNGAGKTTTISVLCTLARPTGGTASVGGFDVVVAPSEVRRRIGLVFQDTTLEITSPGRRTSGSTRSCMGCRGRRRAFGSAACWRWWSSGNAAAAWWRRSPAG